jgi:hypothetical protein
MYPKEKHKTLLHASMEFGLELNPKERLYVDTTWPECKKKNHNIEQFTYENIWTKRKEMKSGWEKMDYEEFHNLYSSLNTIRVIT